ncbi:MAG TPA: FG-GAP-like repeat-containing protein [Kofleriaceae bacterium]|nr:FG-GAP-like repeat-containing protein [Kofleriaceae bacterium]
MSAQTVKLPGSPGSVRGLAENATVSGYTGQVQYQVPVELPSGPGGLSPSLSLGYDGGLGNGPLGVGWALSQAGIRRSLRLGVPSYDARDELELIGLGGGGQLVALANGEYRVEGLGNGTSGRAVDGGFELVDADGRVRRFGTTAAGRKASGSQVAMWFLEEVRDVAGQTIRYQYTQDRGEVYLESIAWGPTLTGGPAFRAELVYESRSDAVVSYRTGFRVESARRLSEIRVWSYGVLRRVARLSYEGAFALTRLHGVTVQSADGQDALPPLTFTYAGPQTSTVTPIADLGGWALNAQGTSLFDVDGDGAMDLLRLTATGHSYRRNLGGRFDAPRPVTGAAGASLDQVRLLDLNGDSGAELVWQQGSQWTVFQLSGPDANSRSWTTMGAWGGSQSVGLGSVAVADLNGDYRMDVVSVSGSSIQVRFGTEAGLAAPVLRSAIDPARPFIAPGNSATSFPDINGDGLADVVYLSSTAMFLYLGKGNGQFEKYLDVAYPWTGSVAISQIRLGDLNRDGLLDLAVVRAGDVAWYRGLANGTVDATPVLLTRPAGTDATVVVALADVNGNGSEDLVWSSPAGMWVLDFAGATSAGMLTAIDNGMGQRQLFEYQASAQLAFDASDAGTPWTATMPVSIPVSIKGRLELASGEPPRSSRLDVRDGIYDRSERRFLGFRESTLTRPDPADGAPLDQIIRRTQRYADGLGIDRALRGQVIFERIADGTGKVFRETTHDAAAVAVAGLPAEDARLRRAIVRSTSTLHYEGQAAPITTRIDYAYDSEARPIEERSLGRTDLTGDESLTRRRYTDGRSARGVRDKECETSQFQVAADGTETAISQRQTLYGDDQQVAVLCDASTGWERASRSYLAGEARWVDRKLTAYDALGNAVEVQESGVVRALAYDAARVHAIAETVAPRPGKTLRWEATWDNVLGVPVTLRDAAGIAQRVTYDGLGRIVATARDTAPPHSVERYHVAGPRPYIEHFTFDGDGDAVVALPSAWTPASHWRHQVDVLDSAGEPLFSATRIASDRWLVADYRRRDALGRTIAIADAFEWQGAAAALPAAALPASVPVRATSYDALDRPVARTLPTGSVDHYTYRAFETTAATDGLAPVTTRLDGEGRVRRAERTVAGALESVDATYDAAGHITSMRVAGGGGAASALHRFSYDTLGRVTFASDPDTGDRHLDYDDGDRLVGHTNGAGQTVAYTYDGAGRLAEMTGSDGAQYTYHYDDALDAAAFGNVAGRLAWVEEPTGQVELGYDAFGRTNRTRRAVHGHTADERTTLSASGLTLRIAYDDGLALDYQYDAAGRATAIGDLWQITSQDARGRILAEQFGNGVVQSYQRDALGQPTHIEVTSPTATLFQADVTYNAFSAVTAIADTDGHGLDHTAAYSFDGGGRLLQALVGQGAAQLRFAYQYDALQNMTRREAHGSASLALLTGSYRYGEPGATGASGPRQLTSIAPDAAAGSPAGAATMTFAYDAAGRAIQHGARALDYNGFDQLVRVTGVSGGTGTVEHAYGYDGQRVWTRDPQGVEQIWFNPTVSQAADGTRDYFLRLGSKLIARLTRSPSALAAAARVDAIGAGLAVGRAISLVLWGACLGLLALVLAMPRRRRRSRAAIAALALTGLVTAGCSPMTQTERSALAASGRILYYHPTVGAGATLSTRSDGTVFEERRAEPFGAPIDAYRELPGGGHETVAVDYGRDPNNALNKLTDPATGWSDHGARWMVPETGRWLTPDPLAKTADAKLMQKPWALHPYQYVQQNPVAYWDPDGKQPAPTTGETPWTILRSAIGMVNILSGSSGITVTGSKADIKAWNNMLIETWGSSATARQLLSDIGNDTDKSHAITVNLGRKQAGVLVDSFGTKDVDLDDIDHFPVTPSTAHPNEMTRGEQVVHILAERRSANLSSNPNDFTAAHTAATAVHNQLRGELGQTAETSATGSVTRSGGIIGTTTYTGGATEDIEFNANGDIIKMTKP